MLRVRGLRKRLGGQTVLDGLDLDCEAGTATAIFGANGSGKSTLLSIIAGVLEPDAGAIDLDGVSLATRRARARTRLGYVPEAANPPGHLTCAELLALVAGLARAEPLTAELRTLLGLDDLADHRIERMSLGERRRTCLGAALIGDPRLLVLDEPTNGLDATGTDTLVDLLTAHRDTGAAILVATHDTDFADRLEARKLELRKGTVWTL